MQEWEYRHTQLTSSHNADQIEKNALFNNVSTFEYAVLDETLTDELPDLMSESVGVQNFHRADLVKEELVGGAIEIVKKRLTDLGQLYPFIISGGSLEIDPGKSKSSWVYKFCLFASLADDLVPTRDLRACFELLALETLVAFAGSGARGMRTGHPWDLYSHKFLSAKEVFAKLRDECNDAHDWSWQPIEELPDDPTYRSLKDLGLDVVVWKGMPDSRGGNKYFLGQCATGRADLERKSSELSLTRLQEWMRLPDAAATRTFITPFYILNESHIRSLCRTGGLVFDRSRIVKLVAQSDSLSQINVDHCQKLIAVVENAVG